MLLIGTDSNYGESTQMLLEKTQIKTCCHMIIQRGGKFECFSVYLSFYKLFPTRNIVGQAFMADGNNMKWSVAIKDCVTYFPTASQSFAEE